MKNRASLYSQYVEMLPSLQRLERALIDQLVHLVNGAGLTLGVPIESRIKSWDSVTEKLERKRLKPRSLTEVEDLVGLRTIFLFQKDLDAFEAALSATFTVLKSEDASTRLGEAQFGYLSKHYLISVPSEWERVPSLRGLINHKAELQVRTVAQHIWAAASHKLQYKHEDSVPQPLRRAIYRVSALLETVDLELSRVLNDRDQYVETQSRLAADADLLDVTVIETVLDDTLPKENKDELAEDYSELLADLQHFGIQTRGELRTLITETLEAVMRADSLEIAARLEDDDEDLGAPEERGESESRRLARGVFFTHVGLARQALCERFGDDDVRDWLMTRSGDA